MTTTEVFKQKHFPQTMEIQSKQLEDNFPVCLFFTRLSDDIFSKFDLFPSFADDLFAAKNSLRQLLDKWSQNMIAGLNCVIRRCNSFIVSIIWKLISNKDYASEVATTPTSLILNFNSSWKTHRISQSNSFEFRWEKGK